MPANKTLHVVAFFLLIAGGLNGGLYALAGVDVIAMLGSVEQIIWILIGAAAVYELATHKQSCKVCG